MPVKMPALRVIRESPLRLRNFKQPDKPEFDSRLTLPGIVRVDAHIDPWSSNEMPWVTE